MRDTAVRRDARHSSRQDRSRDEALAMITRWTAETMRRSRTLDKLLDRMDRQVRALTAT